MKDDGYKIREQLLSSAKDYNGGKGLICPCPNDSFRRELSTSPPHIR